MDGMTPPPAAAVDALVERVPVHRRGHALAPGLTVLDLLSRGDALDVYAVWSTQRSCICVAKTVRPDRSGEDRVRERLLLEGRLLLSLTHPHLVRAYDVLDGPGPIVVLETLVGERLDDLLYRQTRRPPLTDLGYLGLQLCSALRYLHRRGYLHLDVKPDNIIACGGVAKLIDLSLARPPGHAPQGIGTREYLAPEQATGDVLTAATDVWGLGVTMYEAATGIAPFVGGDPDDAASGVETSYPQVSRRAAPVRSLRRRLSAPLAQLIDACLEPDPARRPTLCAASAVFARLTPDPPPELLREVSGGRNKR